MAKSLLLVQQAAHFGARRVRIQVHLKERRTYTGGSAYRQAAEIHKNHRDQTLS
jgi:hypothetical protein